MNNRQREADMRKARVTRRKAAKRIKTANATANRSREARKDATVSRRDRIAKRYRKKTA
jgi:hypothetical protein